MADSIYEKVFDLAKRRGFVYPAFDLYGGAAGFYDYGPLGAQLKARLEDLFRRIFVIEDGCAEISAPAITIEPVLKASGHIDHFSDVIITCAKCGSGFRADHFLAEQLDRIGQKAQKSGASQAFKDYVKAQVELHARQLKEKPTVEVAEAIRQLGIVEENGAPRATKSLEGGQFVAKNFQERLTCSSCGATAFQPAGPFNLMFKTFVGPGSAKPAYLRPETAQAMFVDFPYLYRHFRERLPFGVCQIGRAYRNEISPRQGLIRLREFNQMEVELFFDPKRMTHPNWRRVKNAVLNLVPNTTQQMVALPVGEAVKKKLIVNQALGYYLVQVQRLLVEAGLDPGRLRFRQHLKDEMAHYANDCWDAEFHSQRFDWVECVGVADRGTFDLTQHATLSGQALNAVRRFDEPQRRESVKVVPNPAKLGPMFKGDAPKIAQALARLSEADSEQAQAATRWTVSVDGKSFTVPRDAFDVRRETETKVGEEFVPRVIEPSFGQDRIIYAILEHNFHETAKGGETYAVLTLPPGMAPIAVGVFPLMPKDGLDAVALKLAEKLKRQGFNAFYDDSGTIGRRYARMDEVGTPFAVTVDYDTLEDRSVTVRDRDTTKQERVPVGRLATFLRKRLAEPSDAARPPAPAPPAAA